MGAKIYSERVEKRKWTISLRSDDPCTTDKDTAFYQNHSTSIWKEKRRKIWHALFDKFDRNDILWYYIVYFHMDFDLYVKCSLCVYSSVCHVSGFLSHFRFVCGQCFFLLLPLFLFSFFWNLQICYTLKLH